MEVNERQKWIMEHVFGPATAELYRKGREYEVNGDCNGNFKRVATKTGQSVYEVWFSHFQKHMDAIENFVKDPSRKMAEPLEGRVVDAINYLGILASLKYEVEQAAGDNDDED
jgi:hypothetical protein